MSTVHPPTAARPIGRRQSSRRFVALAWLIALLVAASLFGLWLVYGGTESTEAPVMHLGPPAAGTGVVTTRTTFRDLTDPEHPRSWTLERSYRTKAVDVPATVEGR
jgi:hypothetical protein